jgi:hypothetical protein
MMAADADAMREIATECVDLVETKFAVTLDWSLGSLEQVDAACAALLADGPLAGERLDLWWNLIGAYVGEVLLRAYDGEWTVLDDPPDTYAVRLPGASVFPFETAGRVLTGEPFKSFASLGRAYPAILERRAAEREQRRDGPDELVG